MGLLEKIFPKASKERLEAEQTFKTFTAYKPVFTTWDGQLYESELVRAATDARARHISKLKVDFRGAANPTLRTIVKKRPNEFQTWSQFLYRLSVILDVNNTAFIAPVENRNGDLKGYYPLLPNRCEIVSSKGIEFLRYTFSNGSHAAIELNRCGILTKHQYRDDFFGDKNTALIPTMDLMHLQNQGIKEAVKNGASFRFMARLTNFRNEEDLAKERRRFTADNLASDGGFLLFPSTYDSVQQIHSNPFTIDADQVRIIQENVFNYFGVNDKVLKNTANGDELDAFYEGAIEPFAVQLSEVLTKMTFSPAEQGYGAEAVVLANRLQYMTTSNKIAFVRDMGDRGYITINEARELLNYAPLDGEEGNKRPARGEYYFVDENGNSTQKNGGTEDGN